jgi:hypothetical protein
MARKFRGRLRERLKSLVTAPKDPARALQLLEGIPPESAFASFRLAIEAALARKPADPLARARAGIDLLTGKAHALVRAADEAREVEAARRDLGS